MGVTRSKDLMWGRPGWVFGDDFDELKIKFVMWGAGLKVLWNILFCIISGPLGTIDVSV